MKHIEVFKMQNKKILLTLPHLITYQISDHNIPMGFFLSTISDELSLLSHPHHKYSYPFSKVRQYHGIFKSECTDFLINQTQYEHIFSNKDDLSLWGNNKTANALQLFSGLAFYAQDCSFKSKVRFLFMLFDFNEIKSISIVDLEYMLLSICDFTYKVLGKINTKTDQLKLAEWLASYLNPRKRITVTRLYRLCAQAQEIWTFLYIAGATKSQLQSVELTNIQQTHHKEKREKFEQQEVEAKISWFNTLCNKLTKPKYKEQIKTNPHLTWVYGIEIDAYQTAFIAIEGPVLLYAVSNKMIVFNAPNRHQLIYDQHVREITAFCMRKSDRIVASAEGKQLPHIYIWNYETLQTISIIRLDYAPKIKLMSLSEHQPMLAVIGQRQNSPVLLIQTISWSIVSSLRLLQSANHLQPFSTVISNTTNELQGCFVISGANTLIIVDQQGEKQNIKYQNDITALAVCQLNSDYPYLRLFSTQKLCLFVVTGHKNGSIFVWQYTAQCEDINEIQKYQILTLQHEIIQLIITPQALFVCTAHELSIYNLSVLLNNIDNRQEIQIPRSLKLNDLQQLKLMSKTIHNISVTEDEICILTKQGDLVVITDRQVVFDGETFNQNEGAYRVPNLVKFDKQMRALCFLQKQLHNILLVISGSNQLMQIDPQTHQIDLVLTIKVNDVVNVIDSAVNEEGNGVIVCGCLSGKLIIRYDWEQIGKVIECGSEVSDLKISPQGSALLVATINTLLLFHLGQNISSPRKLQFYNQTPLTLNFLDNSKFCAVSTSARNVYLIELPALKHRSVFKQVQNFAASELCISYPRGTDISGLPCPNIVGGDMKFYIIGLQSGAFLYFPSMSSLQRRNYLLLDAHCSPISNIATNQDQTCFFTLGQQDSMLLQWSVEPMRGSQSKYAKSLQRSAHSRFDWQHYFKKIRKISEAPPQTFDYSLSTFFVKGTKSRKLNRRLKSDLNLIKRDTLSSQQLALSKRHCNYSIRTSIVYGLQNMKINQIRYKYMEHEDSTIIYSASRFILEYNKKDTHQKILECGSKRIAYLDLNEKREVVWAEYGQKPWIWIDGKRIIQTTHPQGLLHFSIHKDFIISYGIDNKSYTINLHNMRTRKLIAQRTTDSKIASFLLISQKEFVSLPEVRRWNNFVVSEIYGFASAATILPNHRDICLGGFSGQLSVLSQNAVVQVARQAHTKQITVMKTNHRDGHFQLITASQDQTIKIWNEYFEQLLVIDLKIKDDFALLIDSDDDAAKYLSLSVCSLDSKGEKILVGFSHGQIWELTVSTQIQNLNEGIQFGSSLSLKSDMSQYYADKCKSFTSEKKLLSYKVTTNKIIDAHTANRAQGECYVCFDVHATLPILATAGNDGRLIISDYEHNQVLANYLCGQKNKVTAIRFSPKGRMLVIGITGGSIITFYVNAMQDKNEKIVQLNLQTFQTFKSNQKLQVIQIQFDVTGQYFSASYWKSPKKGSNTQLDSGHLKIFKQKSQKNNNNDEAFYQQKQTIQSRLQDKAGNGLSKLVLRIHWKNINGKHYILLYSEHTDTYRKSKHNGKYQIYCLQEKSYLSDEFAIEWIHFNFANLLNTKTVAADREGDPQKYAFTAMHSQQKLQQRLVICGGMDGRLHLLHKEMLYSENEEIEDKVQNMCLSRVYNSHSTSITRIHIARSQKLNKKYVFITAYGDETLVQYQLVQQDPDLFLEHQIYPRQIADSQILNQCPSKQHFYLMLNNCQPLRQQLTSVVQDVEKKTNRQIALKPQRIFGRRAFDRRYNLALYKNSALYSIGPNIVIQSLSKNQSQQLMKADPSPLSHYPQISSFHYQGRWLAITTQQERGMLYIWDISSRSCLTSMHLQCSIVLMIRFCGDENIVLYGFNDKYQTVILLLNWRNKTIIGRSRMLFSGNWIIRDISPLSIKNNNLQFVTCGHLHLCYWQLRGDSLVYHNFNSQHKTAYISVRSINNYIVSGCQQGLLYLWLNFQLIHILKDTHRAAVCCLQVDPHRDIIISGGKDGLVFLMKIDQNKLSVFNKVQLNDPIDITQSSSKEQDKAWKVEYQIQSIALTQQPLNEQSETMLIGTRSGAIYSIEYTLQQIDLKAKLVMQGHDHQNIIAAAFSTDNRNCFFTLSNAGIIDSWNIPELKKVFSFDLGRRALQIQTYGARLLVCFRNEIAVYRVQSLTLSRQQQFCIDTRRGDSQSSESRQSEIIRMCFSSNNQNLAVCIKICTKQPLYQINLYEFGSSKQPVHITYNLKHEIDYIDFSTDDRYLLFKDRYEEIGMLTLYNREYKRINTIFVEMKIEWQQEGLRISPHAQRIYYSYSCQNKITAITKLGSNRIIIGDEMGTIRIFEYPCPEQRLGELHLQCYSNHMNDIHFIKTHPEMTHILTAALQDRSLMLWRVVEHPTSEIFSYL